MVLPHIFQKSPTGESLCYVWFSAMHTRVDLIFIGHEAESFFLHVANLIQKEIVQIEQIGNCFNPTSEISQVNSSAPFCSQEISNDLYLIIKSCLDYNLKTFGLFDITTDSKNFSKSTISKVSLSENHFISLEQTGIHLNLSGFLKGFALERIRTIIQNHKILNALVNMGNSSILALGNQINHQGWDVKLQRSEENIVLRDECLTTSGNETIERKHLVNPLTGKYLSGIHTLSVVTQDGIEGEVLSTALLLANKKQKELMKQTFQIKRVIEIYT